MAGDPWTLPLDRADRVLFAGFLLQDLVEVVAHYPHVGKVDVLLHHALFIVCSLFALHFRMFSLAFTWLSAGELSTIFLNLRFFAEHYEWKQAMRGTIDLVFAASFFLVRIVLFGGGALHMLANLELVAAPAAPKWTVVALVVGGAVLNVVSFRKIVRMATRGPRPEKPEAKAKRIY